MKYTTYYTTNEALNIDNLNINNLNINDWQSTYSVFLLEPSCINSLHLLLVMFFTYAFDMLFIIISNFVNSLFPVFY